MFKVFTILTLVALSAAGATGALGDDWVYYGGSHIKEIEGATLRDWYTVNSLKPVPRDDATALHFYDQDSIGSNYPYPGGIVRVWEKAVLRGETRSYEEARAEVEREGEERLKRKIGPLDYAWLFPSAVNRATKEIQTLYEINCDTLEFFVMEVNQYDNTGSRMIRETNMEMTFWIPIRPGTIMDVLSKELCKQ